jgi:hypothetical protein
MAGQTAEGMNFLSAVRIQIAVRFQLADKITEHIGFTGSDLDP